jgi:hypothetical protein
MGGTCDVREEPGKQKTRSCGTQELARSSARENEWQKKACLPKSDDRRDMSLVRKQRKRNAKTLPVVHHSSRFDDVLDSSGRCDGERRMAKANAVSQGDSKRVTDLGKTFVSPTAGKLTGDPAVAGKRQLPISRTRLGAA